jgi:hypothetical protein
MVGFVTSLLKFHCLTMRPFVKDDNRSHLLEVGLPQTIVHLLEGYVERIQSESVGSPLSLTIPHLKVVRNAIGVLLNSSVGYGKVWLTCQPRICSHFFQLPSEHV